MSKNKKKEDIGIEKWSTDIDGQINDALNMVGKHRIKAEVIDCPPTVVMIFPKELFGAGLGCAIYNALEKERGSNVVWRIR